MHDVSPQEQLCRHLTMPSAIHGLVSSCESHSVHFVRKYVIMTLTNIYVYIDLYVKHMHARFAALYHVSQESEADREIVFEPYLPSPPASG